MNVNHVTIDISINKAFDGVYQIPTFQRDFKWKEDDIAQFAESVLQGLPCGSIVIWDPVNSPNVQSDLIKVPLNKKVTKNTKFRYFNPQAKPFNYKVVIDGRQRITSLAIVFGGFTGNHGAEGKYFIDLNSSNINGSVSFMKMSDILANGFNQETKWLESGLFPLSTFESEESKPVKNRFNDHWSYIHQIVKAKGSKQQKIRDKQILDYVGSVVMAELEIHSDLTVADVAHSFEVLNSAGQPVQLVDILHALLSGYYSKVHKKVFNFREWIEKIGSKVKTSHGWGLAAETDGQLIGQMIVSTHLFLDNKKGSRKSKYKPESIRKKDIVALSEDHWHEVISNEKLFCEAIYKFQIAVLGNQFPKNDCPYAISSCLYVGLYWKMKVEKLNWDESRFNKIYKAYFWISALTQRFTADSFGVVDDMDTFIKLMELDEQKWFSEANNWLTLIQSQKNVPSTQSLQASLLTKPRSKNSPDGPAGAFKDALLLPVKHKTTKDIIAVNTNISYPSSCELIEMHHIFPRNWVMKNKRSMGSWNTPQDLIEKKDCIANLTPLLDSSNINWGDSSPATVLQDLQNGAQRKGKKIWVERFIDDACFDALTADDPVTFLEKRSQIIAEWIFDQTILQK